VLTKYLNIRYCNRHYLVISILACTMHLPTNLLNSELLLASCYQLQYLQLLIIVLCTVVVVGVAHSYRNICIVIVEWVPNRCQMTVHHTFIILVMLVNCDKHYELRIHKI